MEPDEPGTRAMSIMTKIMFSADEHQSRNCLSWVIYSPAILGLGWNLIRSGRKQKRAYLSPL